MPQRRFHRRRGMALVMVIAAVAIATVLGYAVLAQVSTTTRISETSLAAAQADALAESGVNFALYNLQHPSTAPPFTGAFWPGATGLSLPSTPGTFGVTITSSAANSYTIVSTATVPSGTVLVRRSVTAAVTVTTGFSVSSQAAGFNAGVSLTGDMVVDGDLRAAGSVTLANGATVNGTVYASSLTLAGSTLGGTFEQTNAATSQNAPTAVNDFTNYTLGGIAYSGTLLTTDPVAGSVLGPTPSNPAGVYYVLNRDLNLNGITINGTLIAKNGNVVVKGSTPNTISPTTGFPGLVVDKALKINGTSRTLTVDGLTWLQQGLTRAGTDNSGSIVTVNGSLLIPGAAAIASAYNGSLRLNYNAGNSNVPNFSTQMQSPTSIIVNSWSQ